ncbi:unnamed protein product [Ranitomeya imitator]|uniref:Reverse transcriptase domain-containing protein n=1 Tax=Ranitomeya imitator TaxID=111125 RepID=A0ABN9LH78_9NEOB|nr:unnamed protein product [Ranitomeya imitator]
MGVSVMSLIAIDKSGSTTEAGERTVTDTGHFLSIIRQLDTVPPDSTLVTLDVNSLYTSIQHSKGMEVTKHLLQLSNMSNDAIQFCLDLLHIVLYENYFLWGDTFYVQRCGTAMGSNVTPAYANAFMNFFKIMHVYTNDLFRQHILGYHRYIDDVFFIWTGTTDSLMSFYAQLNSILPELQFTIHHDKKSVPFLDTRVLLDIQGHLTTDLYCKATDCNSLLHYTSCHPRSMKNCLPHSQFSRVARIVSDPITRKDRLDTIAQRFQERHYPTRLLQEEKIHASIPQSPPPPRHTIKRVPFVHTYHPLMPKVHSIIRKHWPLLSRAYPNIKTFGEPVLMCTKRPPNIKDKLSVCRAGDSATLSAVPPHRTFSYSSSSVSFLDLNIMCRNGNLTTCLYRKPTATNNLLEFRSFHPFHTKKGIPIGQFLRSRRNCTLDDDFQKEAQDLTRRFKRRTYPKKCVSQAYQRARGQSQVSLLESKKKPPDKFVHFITGYNTHWSKVRDILQKHWGILTTDLATSQVVSERPLITARRAPNLRDILTRSHYIRPTIRLNRGITLRGSFPCGDCNICQYMYPVRDCFCNPIDGTKHGLKSYINCKTTNVIYAIICPCPLIYVGQTSQELRRRMQKHVSTIGTAMADARREKPLTSVASHFLSHHAG